MWMRLLLGFLTLLLVLGGVLMAKVPVVRPANLNDLVKAIGRPEPVVLTGNVLFVSDFQLTAPTTRYTVDVENVHHVVILGDLFDSTEAFRRFGGTDGERIANGVVTFLPPDYTGAVYFISAYKHDPALPISVTQLGEVSFAHLGKYGRFVVNGAPVIALHGVELYSGVAGGGISWLFRGLGYPLPLERIARQRLGLPDETWLVTAHSHVPALDPESRTANTGSFAGVPLNALFRLPTGTAISFPEAGEVQLVQFAQPQQ